MREILTLRLRGPDAGDAVEYCIASADAAHSFQVQRAPLASVLAQAAQRRVIVLVPGSEVRIASVQVPARQAAKALQAAPYALEDQLADDIDDLHFALGARQADQRWPVAAVAHASMQTWLAPFIAAGIEPEAVIPDVLALATPDPGQFNALLDDGQLLVRSAADSAFSCTLDDLSLCLALADPERQRRLRLAVPHGQALDLSMLDWPVEPLHGFASALEVLLQQRSSAATINLLQGRYARRSRSLRWFAPWRHAAMLALAALALAAALHGAEAWRLGRALAAQDNANISRYQQVFPAETRIVDLQAQLDQQLAALKQNGGQSSMLPLLGTLHEALTAVPGLSVQSLQYRDGALYAGFTAKNLEALDALKTWFGEAHGASLAVESANSGTEGAQIRVRLSPA